MRVVAYAGGRGEEEPRALELDGRLLAVQCVVERWVEPRGRGFRVLAEDGKRYELFCDEPDSAWHLLGRPGAETPGTAAKVAFLSRPASYAERPLRVEVIETHMAWVFLTSEHAYKMKKPVRYEFLDFSTLAARERDCREELRLNRRLAERVYLGVVPLTLEPNGRLQLGGQGNIVEWLVRMRRLPDESMLDAVIARGDVSSRDVERLAEMLAHFYQELPPEPIAPGAYVALLRRYVTEDRDSMLEAGLEVQRMSGIATDLLTFLDRHAMLMEERVRTGRIVEAHGDLRPEHVCLSREPAIIDCLEFKREFRILDTADELAYFAMECEQLGAPELGRAVISVVGRITGDVPPAELIEFYMARRAFLRAKLAIWHLRDSLAKDLAKWTRKGLAYLAVAETHISAANRAT